MSGVVLTPSGPVAGSVVYSRSAGVITCVGGCDTSTATVVCTDGIVSPGLIDAHNHLQYNSLPPWQVGAEFEDRYEWRSDDRYYEYRTAYDAISDDYSCEIDKWAEARELVHGTTSVVGSYGDACIDVLIRNLDEDSGASGLSGYSLEYSSGTVTDSIDDGDCSNFSDDLSNGSLAGVLEHVAEGRGGSVRDEIDHMFDAGCVGPGQAFVHATDASSEQLARMASEGTAIVWSPRSNLALYGTTTPIEIADRMGVSWAIGTDWTPSGSMAPTRELACAADWLASKGNPISDVRLWEKVTTDAARIVGLDGVLGELTVGYKADIAVYAWDRTPYRAIITSEPGDVRLVVLDGDAIYGRTEYIDVVSAHPEWCEPLDVCGESQSVCVSVGTSGDDAQSLEDIENTLNAAMSGVEMPPGYEYAGALYPLFACVDEAASCNLSEPTSGDVDGDGVIDEDDGCPEVYDPEQWDTDADGVGDACDDCPLAPDTSDCEPIVGDADGDGVADADDNCGYVANADQADADADGAGDLCDDCPDVPNPDGAGCPVSIQDLRDPTSPNHPEDGDTVSLTGLVVTAVRFNTTGFWVQDPSLAEWAGVFVYTTGAEVVAGDVVDLTGTYLQYFGLDEVEPSSITVTGTAPAPEPILVDDACTIGTDGVDAARYQSMLVGVSDVRVTDADPDAPDDFDEFVVDGCLRVDDSVYDDLDQSAVGTDFDRIVGVLNLSYDFYKMEPRDAGDLE